MQVQQMNKMPKRTQTIKLFLVSLRPLQENAETRWIIQTKRQPTALFNFIRHQQMQCIPPCSFNIRFLYRHLCYIVFYSSLSSSLFCSLHRRKAVYTLLLGALVRRIRHVRANVYIAAVHCIKCEDNAMQWRQWWQCWMLGKKPFPH